MGFATTNCVVLLISMKKPPFNRNVHIIFYYTNLLLSYEITDLFFLHLLSFHLFFIWKEIDTLKINGTQ
jgi:hypothetical protein